MKRLKHVTSKEPLLLRQFIEQFLEADRQFVFLGWSYPDQGILIEADAGLALLAEQPHFKDRLMFRIESRDILGPDPFAINRLVDERTAENSRLPNH